MSDNTQTPTDQSTQQQLTFAYAGREFELKLLYQILLPNNINNSTGKIFYTEVMDVLEIQHFSDVRFKRLFQIIKNHYEHYKNVPNYDNIMMIINAEEKNPTEVQFYKSILEYIKSFKKRYLDGEINNDSDLVKNEVIYFLKSHGLNKVVQFITEKNKLIKGRLTDEIVNEVIRDFTRIQNLGQKEDFNNNLLENVEHVLRDDFRLPEGIGSTLVDRAINGGISKGEIMGILGPKGGGKSTLLSYIGFDKYRKGHNVLHALFEGRADDIKRKHYVMLTGIPYSQLSKRKEEAIKIIEETKKDPRFGHMEVIRFQENYSVEKLFKWMKRFEEKKGIKFDTLILDYVDCLKPDIHNKDKWLGQEEVVESLEQHVDREEIYCYTGLQCKKEVNNKRILEEQDIYGSDARGKKMHCIMSIGSDFSQKQHNQFNPAIIKSRFSRTGSVWENSSLNAETMFLTIAPQSNEIDLNPESSHLSGQPVVTPTPQGNRPTGAVKPEAQKTYVQYEPVTAQNEVQPNGVVKQGFYGDVQPVKNIRDIVGETFADDAPKK